MVKKAFCDFRVVEVSHIDYPLFPCRFTAGNFEDFSNLLGNTFIGNITPELLGYIMMQNVGSQHL